MKMKFDFATSEVARFNDPAEREVLIAEAHDLLNTLFEKYDEYIKCSITVDSEKI